jgi:hypothetical protein
MPTRNSDIPRPFGPSLKFDREVFDDLSAHTPLGLPAALRGGRDGTEPTDAE